MLMIAYHPAASQIACRFGTRALGRENLGSLWDCTKALRPCPAVISDSLRCVNYWKLWGVGTPSHTDTGNSARKSEQSNMLYKIIVQGSENKPSSISYQAFHLLWFTAYLLISFCYHLLSVIGTNHWRKLTGREPKWEILIQKFVT